MERRDLLKMIAAATGVAFVGADAWAGGAVAANSDFLTSAEQNLLSEIAETILPATTTPGAKAAGCGPMMARFIQDCYAKSHQQLVQQGLTEIRALAQHQFKQDFVALSSEQKQQLLQAVDQAAKNGAGLGSGSSIAESKTGSKHGELHYFVLLKQLTIFTFFTSKVGATEVLRYVAVPGKYDGNLPYKKGDRAWATGG